MISVIENLQRIFIQMRNDGWDMSKPLKWGFYFVDSEKQSLESVYSELRGHHYKLESLTETEDGLWQLIVTKEEALTPNMLHRRNLAFNELAAAYKVEVYDGWDVERP